MNEVVMPVLTKEQRGEIKLANPVLETYYQDNLKGRSIWHRQLLPKGKGGPPRLQEAH